MIQLHLVLAAKIPLLHLGSSIRGTTTGAPHMVQVDMYNSGQALFEVPVSRELLVRLQTQNTSFSVTTCSSFTSFDTVLYVFSSNPLNNNVSNPEFINRNDNDCALQSTVQMRVSVETSLYVLLAGYRGSEGVYELRAEEIADGAFPTPWGLDRIDQRLLPLDGQFSVKEAGQGVFIYILDSGVRATHNDFLRNDGTSRVTFGKDFIERLDAVVDETGHGTHVAALAAGKRFGVAKKATIVSVRVLDRTNAGLISQLVEALVWTRNDIYQKNNFPAIITMSLSTSASEVLNDAVAKVTSAGIAVVTAAGNDGKDSCLVSPASEPSALSVGATNSKDQASMISNWGECVSIYAPGEGILSAWHTGDSAEKKLSGTSAACPLVAGATAILLEQNPDLKPNEIKEVIRATGTLSIKENEKSMQRDMSGGKKHLERMLYVRSIPVVLEDGRPPRGKMFLYVIFGLTPERVNEELQQCLLREDQMNMARNILSSVIGASLMTSLDLILCCWGQIKNDCDDGGAFSGNRLIVRVLTRDSYAYSTFESLAAFCNGRKGAVTQLGTALHMNVSVAAEPWVLDSRGYKYWAAPALLHTTNRGLSTTQVVVIITLITLLVLCLVATTLCLIQRSKRKQREKDQDYFQDKASEYEVEKQRHANLRSHEDLKPMHFFSQGMRRENSELQGDILKCLSPSGILLTPTTHGPGAQQPLEASLTPLGTKRGAHLNLDSDSGEAPGVQARTHRACSVRGLPEKTQTSASFFTRLWTPRADRKAGAASSSRGKSPIRGLPKILSFGPERGAIVQPTLPLPEESGITSQITEGDAVQDESDANALQTLDPSDQGQT